MAANNVMKSKPFQGQIRSKSQTVVPPATGKKRIGGEKKKKEKKKGERSRENSQIEQTPREKKDI